MGFFEKAAKSVAKGAVDMAKNAVKDMEKKRERIDRHKERYEDCSDQELRDMLNNTNMDEKKIALIELLQERGY